MISPSSFITGTEGMSMTYNGFRRIALAQGTLREVARAPSSAEAAVPVPPHAEDSRAATAPQHRTADT
jgi:hypothetical protein